MRDWHPYRLEGQESNTKFYVNCQLADSDASRHIKCTVLQQEGVLSGEGSKPEEFMTKKYQQKAISSLQTCSSISFGNYRILPILFSGQNCAYIIPWALKETFRAVPKPLLRADATETWEQQLVRTQCGTKATENPRWSKKFCSMDYGEKNKQL